MMRERTAPRVALLTGGLIALAGSFLPWVISGLARRNSYAAVQSARRIGVVPDGPWQALLLSWFLLPFAVAVVAFALAIGHRRLAVTAGLLAGLGSLGFAIVVLIAPVQAGPGPFVTIIGGAALVTAAVWESRSNRTVARGRESPEE
jgi:hypothetical protein